MFDLSLKEVRAVQTLWENLDLHVPSSKASTISQIKFKGQNIIRLERILVQEQSSQNELISYQFDQIIQMLTLIIQNLSDIRQSHIDVLVKFAKINQRIYDLNLTEFGEQLIVTVKQIKKISFAAELAFVNFLNQIFLFVHNASVDPCIEVHDRLSYSESSTSLSINEEFDESYTESSSLMTKKEIEYIDIDQVDLDTEEKTIIEEEDDDEAFDLLNSFNVKQTKPDKLKKRLSSLNLRAKNEKQDCTIM